MRLKAGNPQDYILFPSLCNCYEAFNSCSTVSHSQIQLLSNHSGEHPSPSPSGQCASTASREVVGILPAASSTPCKHAGGHGFHPPFPASEPPSSSTKGLIYSLCKPFANGLPPVAGTWLPSLLPFHNKAKGRELSARAPQFTPRTL